MYRAQTEHHKTKFHWSSSRTLEPATASDTIRATLIFASFSASLATAVAGRSARRRRASTSMNDTASQTVSKKDNREKCLWHPSSRLPSDPHVSHKYEHPDRKEYGSWQFRDRGARDCPIESRIGCHVATARIVSPVVDACRIISASSDVTLPSPLTS